MPRSVAEWIGKTDDAMPPQSVRDLLLRQQNDCCAGCRRPFGPAGAGRANCDHIVPLRDGGANRQSNLQMLCNWCHVDKTSAENTSRAKSNSIRRKHLGIDQAKSNRPGGFQTNRNGKFKKKVNGEVVLRNG